MQLRRLLAMSVQEREYLGDERIDDAQEDVIEKGKIFYRLDK